MRFSDETLMAYADGELDAETRAAVEMAMRVDQDTARRVAHHLSLAHKLRTTFDPVLREMVPKRLKDACAQTADAAKPASGAAPTVIDLAIARMVRPMRSWSWPQWSAIAASLVIGVLAGRIGPSDQSPSQMAVDGKGVVARDSLERALSTQLASTQAADAPIRIGISFLSKSGELCRTFFLSNEMAGLGCRSGRDWRVHVLARSPSAAQGAGAHRMAAGEAPAAVMREVDERIAGSSLDAREEEAALKSGWRK